MHLVLGRNFKYGDINFCREGRASFNVLRVIVEGS